MSTDVKPKEEMDPLVSQVRNIGYYAGLTFGTGYSLIFLGPVLMFLETIVSTSQTGNLSYISNVPPWRIVTLFFLLVGMIFGISFGSTISKNSKSAKDGSLTIGKIGFSVSAFSFMLLFLWLGSTVFTFVNKLPPFSPVCGVAGAILLLIGFERYREKTSRFVGAIIMLVSIILIYFVAYWNIVYRPFNGLLFSELTIEVSSLIVIMICAIIFSFPILREEYKQAFLGIVLSIVGMVFSAGVIYLNFSALSAFNTPTSIAGVPYLRNIPGYSILVTNFLTFYSESYSALVIFIGFLLLGVSGIISLVTTCLTLTVSIKQLITGPKAPVPEAPPPP
jgi:hypothetical protein